MVYGQADERIIVFTTNHKDRLDLALLRPGRMDVHIHMSHCTFHGFKTLAMNYLKIREHPLFDVIQDLLAKVEASPAEIAGQLMKSGKARTALQDQCICCHLPAKKGAQHQQDKCGLRFRFIYSYGTNILLYN